MRFTCPANLRCGLGRRANGVYGSAANRQQAQSGANVFNIFVATATRVAEWTTEGKEECGHTNLLVDSNPQKPKDCGRAELELGPGVTSKLNRAVDNVSIKQVEQFWTTCCLDMSISAVICLLVR